MAQKRLVIKHSKMKQNKRSKINELNGYNEDRFYGEIEDDEDLAKNGYSFKKKFSKKYKKKDFVR